MTEPTEAVFFRANSVHNMLAETTVFSQYFQLVPSEVQIVYQISDFFRENSFIRTLTYFWPCALSLLYGWVCVSYMVGFVSVLS